MALVFPPVNDGNLMMVVLEKDGYCLILLCPINDVQKLNTLKNRGRFQAATKSGTSFSYCSVEINAVPTHNMQLPQAVVPGGMRRRFQGNSKWY